MIMIYTHIHIYTHIYVHIYVYIYMFFTINTHHYKHLMLLQLRRAGAAVVVGATAYALFVLGVMNAYRLQCVAV